MVLWCALTLHTHLHVLPEAIPLASWEYCSLPTLLARSRCPPSFPQSHFSRTQEKKRLVYLACWRKNQMLLGFKIRKNTCLGQWFAHHDSEAFCAACANAMWAIYVHPLPPSQAFYCQHHCWQMTLKVTHCIFMIYKSLCEGILLPLCPIKLLDSVWDEQAVFPIT